MRVLVIRGRNIASLGGPFELDMETGPIARSGLFAITGPTGAGKSSLLDAMCLALFDRTPRLAGTSRVSIGAADTDEGDRLKATDVRGLLTRGAAEGEAEVVFIGVDGRRYRARWAVNRARKRPDGKLQKQTMTLVCEDTQEALGGSTKGTTLAAIEAKLGLDFDQFRRSVLLAQGQFAELLHAPAAERGQLLERVTGATIYAEVSRAAYARAKLERERLGDLSAKADGLAVLSDDARAALRLQLQGAAEDVRSLAARERSLRDALAWHARHDALEADRGAAWAQLEEAVAAWVALEPGEGGALGALGALSTGPDAAGSEAARAAWLGELPGEVSAAHERLVEARALDHTRDQRHEELRRVVTERSAATAALQAAVESEQRALAEEAAQQARIRELSAWLDQHAWLRPWDQHWALLERDLRSVAAAAEVQSAVEEQRRALLRERQGLEREVHAASAAVAEAEAHVGRCRAAYDEAKVAAAGVDAGVLRAARDAVGAQQTHLAALRVGLVRERALREEQQACRVREGEQQRARDEAERERQLAQARYDTERQARRRVEAALDLEGHRESLVEGEPCPLCGATDHPYATQAPAVAALLQAAQEAERESRDAFERWVAQVATHEAQREAAAARERSLEEGRQREREALGELAAAWDAGLESLAGLDGLAGLGGPAGLDGPAGAAVDSLDAAAATLDGARAALDERLRHADALARSLREAHDALDRATTACSEQRAISAAAGERLAALVAQDARLVERAEGAAAEAERARDEVQARVGREGEGGDWEAAIAADADAFLRERGERVAALRAQREALDTARQRLPELTASLSGLAKDVTAARATAAGLEAQQGVVSDALAEVARAREALFTGATARSVEAVLAAVRAAEVLARERDAKAREHLAARPHPQAVTDAEGAGAQLQALVSALDGAREQQATLAGRLALDDTQRQARAELGPALLAQRAQAERWERLNQLVGQADGARFRDFAQGLTLKIVLEHANQRLRELRPRYRLAVVPGSNLDIQVVDTDMGDEVRSIASLSGGETFLVSLALALGLSESTGASSVETLFIDEGFGTLDSEAFEVAMSTLDALQASGCIIGVISHVEGLADRVGVRAEVLPQGGGLSRVRVVAPGP